MAMNVILLEKIGGLGDLGTQVSVRNGYARNFLLPQGKAVIADKDNIAKFEARRAELEKIAAEKLQAAQARADALRELTLTIAGRAADEGRLYGSIGTHEIINAIHSAGSQVEKSEIRLPNGPLRTIGEHEIVIQLHSDVNVHVKVNVVPEA